MTLGQPPHNKGKSAALDWLRAHAEHNSKECLIWPFSRSRGHAQVAMNGKITKAARIMCEWAHGPAPTARHETAHSCGCGHLGCVNPQHLAWKTRSEDQQDRRKHGTQGRRPNMNARRIGYKLNPAIVSQIRAIGNSMSKEEMGRRFGITPSNVAKILKRKNWKVDGIFPRRGWAVTPWRGGSRRKGDADGEEQSR